LSPSPSSAIQVKVTALPLETIESLAKREITWTGLFSISQDEKSIKIKVRHEKYFK
jgi:hypothetical protein